jgi:hypothetical protein
MAGQRSDERNRGSAKAASRRRWVWGAGTAVVALGMGVLGGAPAAWADELGNSFAPSVVSDPLLEQLQADEVSANAALVAQEVASNTNVLAGETSLESAIAPAFSGLADSSNPTSILDGGVNVLFQFNTLFLGTAENAFNSLLGASFDPATLTGGFGGLRGLMDLSLFGLTDAFQFSDDETKMLTGIEGTLPFPTAAELSALQAQELAACELLNNGLGAFNSNLVASEQAAETAALGSNTALNGLVDRLLNSDNLLLATGENFVTSLMGVEGADPEGVTASLLIPSDTGVFDGGAIGGFEGIFDQYLAAFSDASGLTSADITTAFAPGVFDPTAFMAAVDSAIDSNAFDPFLTALTGPVLTEFATVLASF